MDVDPFTLAKQRFLLRMSIMFNATSASETSHQHLVTRRAGHPQLRRRAWRLPPAPLPWASAAPGHHLRALCLRRVAPASSPAADMYTCSFYAALYGYSRRQLICLAPAVTGGDWRSLESSTSRWWSTSSWAANHVCICTARHESPMPTTMVPEWRPERGIFAGARGWRW
jgi:hypothetical protein